MAINEMDRMFECMIEVLRVASLDTTSEICLSKDQAARLIDTLREIEDIHESYLEMLFDRLSKLDADSSYPLRGHQLTNALLEIRAKLQKGSAQEGDTGGDSEKKPLH